MINSRFSETARGSEPPFLAAGSGRTNLVRTKGVTYLAAAVEGNAVAPGLEALIEEARRIEVYGFTETELDRARRELLRRIERSFTELDNAESDSYMQEYTRHFLEAEAMPGIENEYELQNRFMPEISLDDVNALAESYLAESNRVIMVSAVEKDGIEAVDESKLRLALGRSETRSVAVYVDEITDIPILAVVPVSGRVETRAYYDDVNMTTWTLSNGVRVILKPTDFKNDELLLSAFSPGGTYLYDESEYLSASYADSLVRESGIGELSAVAIEKNSRGRPSQLTRTSTRLKRASGVCRASAISRRFFSSYTDISRYPVRIPRPTQT